MTTASQAGLRSRRASSQMVVAGVMSGTSADGVDVAICSICGSRGGTPKIDLLGHRAFPYPKRVREAVLQAMTGESTSVSALSQLNWRLGALYADAVESACQELGVLLAPAIAPPEADPGRQQAANKPAPSLQLVGCHGQTIHHQPKAEQFLGELVRGTWQIGEAAVLAERLRCPVVSDFRPADMVLGGQGAPLVPMLDAVMFRSKKVGRVLANLGGIANVTALPAGTGIDNIVAFDTGPGNMVIDHCMRLLYSKDFDEDGRVAQRGKVYAGEVMRAMRDGYFAARPPKSCGREEFGSAFADRFIALCRKAGAEDADIVATATALTSSSMIEAHELFVADHLTGSKELEFIVAGGGSKNSALMGMLEGAFVERGVKVRRMDELGVAAEAKEAVAFALLAWLTWQGKPGNVAAATGASRPAVLGKVSFP